MYMYLDDSGNIDSPEGNLYVWAGIAVKSGVPRIEQQLERIFSEFEITRGFKEKKGFDANFEEKKRVFECLMSYETLRIGYLVVDKRLVTPNQKAFIKGATSRVKEQSENHFLSKVVKELAVPYEDPTRKKIVLTIDGDSQRGKESALRLHEFLSLNINFPEWNTDYSWNHFEIKYDSRENQRMLQAVDFVANFILEYYKLFHCTSGTLHPKQVLPMSALYQIMRPKVWNRLLRLQGTSVF